MTIACEPLELFLAPDNADPQEFEERLLMKKLSLKEVGRPSDMLKITSIIAAVRALVDETAAHIQAAAPTVYSRELLDVTFEQPYARISHVVDRGIAQRQTASTYLKRLADIGVLRPVKAGRSKLFVHAKLLRLLTRDANEFEPYSS